MNEDLIYIGEQIRAERKAQNMSQECLALDAEIATRNFRNIENGQSAVRIDNFISICEALSVSPNRLLPERLFSEGTVSEEISDVGYRLARLSDKKRESALQAIDAILKMAES